jgi:hypothetical protein
VIRRPLWLATGAALGVGGTLWAEHWLRRRVRRAVSLLAPGHGGDPQRSVRGTGRWRAAVDAGREERDRREAELWAQLGIGRANRGVDVSRPGAVPVAKTSGAAGSSVTVGSRRVERSEQRRGARRGVGAGGAHRERR